MRYLIILFYVFTGFIDHQGSNPGMFITSSGTVSFRSEAPLETISALSETMKGIVDTTKGTFAFTIAVNSFKGFNSPLQQEHFNENYLETNKYPNATFTGKIIELINFSEAGTHQVRAKGILNIHGVKQERIIKAGIEIKESSLVINSEFLVTLRDHDIKIPRIVHQKIAPDIEVSIQAVLLPNNL